MTKTYSDQESDHWGRNPQNLCSSYGNHRRKNLPGSQGCEKAGADLVEWRADFFEGLMDKEACKQVLGKLSEILGETPLLFTIRTSEEGGNIAISMEDYSACCRNAARSHIADLVDVEVMGNPEEKKKLMASFKGKVSKSLLLPTILTKQTVRKSFWTVSVKWKNPELIF